MDRMDYEDVLREVATLDMINEHGFYALRIRPFAPFAEGGNLRVR